MAAQLGIMRFMQTLRRAHWITRLVLVWFALFIGVAAASPLVKAERLEMVCTGMGSMKLIQPDADDPAGSPLSPGMDCPLCMPVAAPAPVALPLPHPGGLAYALHPLESARLASLIGLPWQARGPPSFSL